MRVRALVAAQIVAACATASAVRADPKIVTSPPCMAGPSGCLRFTPAAPPDVVSEFVFKAPKGGGTAQVSVWTGPCSA